MYKEDREAGWQTRRTLFRVFRGDIAEAVGIGVTHFDNEVYDRFEVTLKNYWVGSKTSDPCKLRDKMPFSELFDDIIMERIDDVYYLADEEVMLGRLLERLSQEKIWSDYLGKIGGIGSLSPESDLLGITRDILGLGSEEALDHKSCLYCLLEALYDIATSGKEYNPEWMHRRLHQGQSHDCSPTRGECGYAPVSKNAVTIPRIRAIADGFFGRGAEIEECLSGLERGSRYLAISGMGAIGKSTLAEQVALLWQEKTGGESYLLPFRESIRETFCTFRDGYKIEGIDEDRLLDGAFYGDVLIALRNALGPDDLLVIDNVGTFEEVEVALRSLPCHVLATTRLVEVPKTFARLDLGTLGDEGCLELFEYKLETSLGQDEKRAAESIISYVSHHTLTVELLARYCYMSCIGVVELEEMMRDSGGTFSDDGTHIRDERSYNEIMDSVFDFTNITLQIGRKIRECSTDEEAVFAGQGLLRALSVLDLRRVAASSLRDWCGLENMNALTFLRGGSWLNWNGGHFSMHDSIREVLLRNLNPRWADIEELAGVLQAKLENARTCAEATPIIDQAVALYARFPEALYFADAAAKSAQRLNMVTEEHALRKALVQTLEREPNLNESILSVSYFELGALQANLGNLDGAKESLERIISREQAGTSPHPVIAAAYNSIGTLAHRTGDLEKAKECYSRAIEIDGACVSSDKEGGLFENPAYLRDCHNIGLLYRDLGDLDGAKRLLGEVLEASDGIFERHDAYHAAIKCNYALLLTDMGELESADSYLSDAVAVLEEVFGEKSPALAAALSIKGLLEVARDNPAAAKTAFEKALAIDDEVLHPDSPALARDCNNLALSLMDEGNLDDADDSLSRALEIGEKALEPSSPNLAILYNTKARLLFMQGNKEGASRFTGKAREGITPILQHDSELQETLRGNLPKADSAGCCQEANPVPIYYVIGLLLNNLGVDGTRADSRC